MSSILTVHDHGFVRVLTLNRPEAANAISHDLGTQLIQAFAAADASSKVRALVLTATGDKYFCAGGDLKERARREESQAERDAFVHALLERRRSTPSIAVVNGLAYGGGLELAISCDFLLCAPHATFALPEVRRGIIASGGGLVRLPALIGAARARQLAITGEPIDADTALRIGLVNEIVTSHMLLDRGLSLASAIAQNAPLAVQASRAIIDSSDHTDSWNLNLHLRHDVSASDDAAEGVRAFSERRLPDWKGR